MCIRDSHSVSSESKESAWQDVQLAFYNGLRAEGAQDSDAKVAYAGAYAFAPRWPLVELIDITVPERDKDTRLYKVNYVPAETKGVSIEEYQALSRDILADPQSVSLQDIRGIVDAADASVEPQQAVVGGSINDLFASNRPAPVEEPAEQPEPSEKVKQKSPLDDLFVDEPILTDIVLPAEVKPEMAEDEVPGIPVEIELPESDVETETTDKAILGPEDLSVDVDVIDGTTESMQSGDSLKVDTELGAQPNVWKILPDGSAVLVQIEG